MAFAGVHGLLKQRPEDFGADGGPVGDRSVVQAFDLSGGEVEGSDGVEEASIEVGGALGAAAGGIAGGVHLPEQPEEQVLGVGAAGGVLEGAGEEVGGELADVLGEHRNHAPQHEPLRGFAGDAALAEAGEDAGDLGGSVAGDGDEVVAELRGLGFGKQERQRFPPVGEVGEVIRSMGASSWTSKSYTQSSSKLQSTT